MATKRKTGVRTAKRKAGLSTAKRTAVVVSGLAAGVLVGKALASRGRDGGQLDAAISKLLQDSRAGRRDTVSGVEMGRTLRLLRKSSAQRMRKLAKA